MIGSDNIGLVFRAKGDTSDAKKAFKDLATAIDRDISGAGGKLAGLAGPAAIASAAVAAVATAAVTTGKFLFDLAQKTSDYGSKIKEAADKTGLSATALSALKVAADQSGSSLEQVTGSITKFSKLVGDAATGSEKAAAALERLGVDPQQAINDLDGALAKVFKRILEAPEGVAQAKLATDAFGRSGADILPVLKSFDGDMAKLIEKAKALGVTFDDQTAAAADEFGDAVDDAGLAIKGLGMAIGNDLIPELTAMAREFTQFVVENRPMLQQWAGDTLNILQGVARGWDQASEAAARYFSWANGGAIPAAAGAGNVSVPRMVLGSGILGEWIYRQGASDDQENGTFIPGKRPGTGSVPFPSGGGRRGGGGRSGGGRRTGDGRDLNARIQLAENELSRLRDLYRKAIDAFTEEFERSGNAEVFDAAIKQETAKFVQTTAEALQQLGVLEDERVKKEKKTAGEIALLQQEREKRWQEVLDLEEKTFKDAEEAKTRQTKKNSDERKELDEEEFRRKLEMARSYADLAIAQAGRDREMGTLSEVDYQKRVAFEKLGVLEAEKKLLLQREKTAEVLQRIKIIDNELSIQQIENSKAVGDALEELKRRVGGESADTAGSGGDPGESGDTAGGRGGGIFGAWTRSWKEFFGAVTGDGPKLGEMLGQVAGMMQGAFTQIAQGLGSIVQNWVLMGETGPAVMKKLLASALASLAAEAATRAIFELAMGFAALFFNPAEATAHFTAAALFGSIAVGTALAGRAIAGDSFKRQTGGAYGTQTQSSGSRSGSGGEVYSSRDKLVLDMARNVSASAPGVTVAINDKTGLFGEFFSVEVGKNGLVRRAIREAIK